MTTEAEQAVCEEDEEANSRICGRQLANPKGLLLLFLYRYVVLRGHSREDRKLRYSSQQKDDPVPVGDVVG